MGTDKQGRSSWDEAKKSALVAQIVGGRLSVKAACERHELSVDTIQEWVRAFRRTTLQALDEHLRQTFLIQGADAAALGSAEYTGTLDDIPIADLIHTFQMGGKDAVITITRGDSCSHLWCDKGQIVDAESGRLRGEGAVYRILSFEQGRVHADFRREPRERSIEQPGNVLLLEAARRKDECARLLTRLGGDRAVYRARLAAPASDTSPTEVLALCDGTRCLSEVLEQSPLGDLESLTALAGASERGELERQGSSLVPPSLALALGHDTQGPVSFLPIVASRRVVTPRRWPRRLALVLGVLALGAVGWVFATRPGSDTRAVATRPPALVELPPGAAQDSEGQQVDAFVVDTAAQPADAELWLDGARAGTGRLRRELARDGTAHTLIVSAAGHAPTTLLFVDAPPPPTIVLEPLKPAPLTRQTEALEPPRPPARRPRSRRAAAPEGPARAPEPATGAQPAGVEAPPVKLAPRIQIIESATPVVRVIE